jgi:hypothetical protein
MRERKTKFQAEDAHSDVSGGPSDTAALLERSLQRLLVDLSLVVVGPDPVLNLVFGRLGSDLVHDFLDSKREGASEVHVRGLDVEPDERMISISSTEEEEAKRGRRTFLNRPFRMKPSFPCLGRATQPMAFRS